MSSTEMRPVAPSLSSFVALEQPTTAPTATLTQGTRLPFAGSVLGTAGSACAAVLGTDVPALLAPAAVLRDAVQVPRPRGAPV